MNTNKKDKQYYIERARADFRNLVVYWNVTRPQYMSFYKVDGRFCLKELVRQMNFLSKWKHTSSYFQNSHAKTYYEYSKNFNYTFDLPNELVKRVLGCYRDDNNKQVRISIDDVIPQLKKEGFLKVCKHGTKTKKDDNGKYKVTCYWHNKYQMANAKQWFEMMNDKRYSKIETFPNASNRIVKFVLEYCKKFKKEEKKVEKKERKKEVKKVDDAREDVRRRIEADGPATFDDLKRIYQNQGMGDIYFKQYGRDVFNRSDGELDSIRQFERPENVWNRDKAVFYGRMSKTAYNTPGVPKTTLKMIRKMATDYLM